jgi:hypothetical protein
MSRRGCLARGAGCAALRRSHAAAAACSVPTDAAAADVCCRLGRVPRRCRGPGSLAASCCGRGGCRCRRGACSRSRRRLRSLRFARLLLLSPGRGGGGGRVGKHGAGRQSHCCWARGALPRAALGPGGMGAATAPSPRAPCHAPLPLRLACRLGPRVLQVGRRRDNTLQEVEEIVRADGVLPAAAGWGGGRPPTGERGVPERPRAGRWRSAPASRSYVPPIHASADPRAPRRWQAARAGEGRRGARPLRACALTGGSASPSWRRAPAPQLPRVRTGAAGRAPARALGGGGRR